MMMGENPTIQRFDYIKRTVYRVNNLDLIIFAIFSKWTVYRVNYLVLIIFAIFSNELCPELTMLDVINVVWRIDCLPDDTPHSNARFCYKKKPHYCRSCNSGFTCRILTTATLRRKARETTLSFVKRTRLTLWIITRYLPTVCIVLS